MTRIGRLAVLLVPLVLGLASMALPGRAQQASSGRYAFSDTTLLRDTLGLHFDQLFPLADSLGIPPDSLRAIAIRFRLRLEQVVHLADSLGMPVDSVGPVLWRERFNPLAQRRSRSNDFKYTSSYDVAQTNSSWTNGSDYNFALGSLFLRNTTTITMERYKAGGATSLRQTRSSQTESGWRFSDNFSAGAKVGLDRFDSVDPGALNNQGETKNALQLSLRARQRPAPGVQSELNFFTGLLDLNNSTQQKRGFSGDLSGRLRYQRGWFTHDVNGQLSGNLARTGIPSSLTRLNTTDLSHNLRGTLGLFSTAPVGLNVNYTFRHTRVETPTVLTSIVTVQTENSGIDGTLRLRRDTDRYLNLTERYSTSTQSTGSRDDDGFGADGRYLLAGWILEGRFANGFSSSDSPRRLKTGGFVQRDHSRSVSGTLSRQIGARFTAKSTGEVSLTSSRAFATADSATPPVPRDQYRQSWRVEGIYTYSERLNGGLALEVNRTLAINIPSSSAAANNEVRGYRAEWRWTYRLFEGLTATQRDQLSADYRFFSFTPDRNDLSLSYSAVTTLSAVVTPRFSFDLTHNALTQPRGIYTRDPDGLESLKPSDESRNYTLSSRITYAPSTAFSLSLSPEYLAIDRDGTLNGESVPQRRSRSLNFSGGANLNFKLGARGQLSGTIARTYRADRSTNYASGVPQVSPRSESDYWNGSLQLSWQP